MDSDIRCTGCNRRLAKMQGEALEVRHGAQRVWIVEGEVSCERCGTRISIRCANLTRHAKLA